jgi:predicted polyphosphate/ATP-dependent NAD kinase
MRTIGFLVNPIAGMGGTVGLKGTDGSEVLAEARARGASPVSPMRVEQFLKKLEELAATVDEVPELKVLCAKGMMGAKELASHPSIAGKLEFLHSPKEETRPEDTRALCRRFLEEGAELVLFCGGDGTARDVHSVVGTTVPILGIPAGVKMHSAVFGLDPSATASLFIHWLLGNCGSRDAEVMDIDEEAFREGRLEARLFGFARTPYEQRLVQTSKSVYHTVDDEHAKEGIARYLEEIMSEKDTLFILGPGSTTAKIAETLGIEKTLLGVDLIRNGKLLGSDVWEKQMLEEFGEEEKPKAKVIVSVIGSQGFIFGRGNQQISAKVLRKLGKHNIITVATPAKMEETPVLRVDTGDPELDRKLAGFVRVIVGYHEMRMTRLELPGDLGSSA